MSSSSSDSEEDVGGVRQRRPSPSSQNGRSIAIIEPIEPDQEDEDSSASAEDIKLNPGKRNPGLAKIYSEGIDIVHEGPELRRSFASYLDYLSGAQSFKGTAVFLQKMVPFSYRTILVYAGPAEEGEEGAVVAIGPPQYFEQILYRPKWVMERVAETVNCFPKEAKRSFMTTVVYDPDVKRRTFVSGLQVFAPVNLLDLGRHLDLDLEDIAEGVSSSDGPAVHWNSSPQKNHEATEPDVGSAAALSPITNGTHADESRPSGHRSPSACTANGVQRAGELVDENCNVFIRASEMEFGQPSSTASKISP